MKSLVLWLGCGLAFSTAVAHAQPLPDDWYPGAEAPSGDPVTVIVGPADAASLDAVIATADPSAPLVIQFAPGTYDLPAPIVITRTHVTFAALHPDAPRPHLRLAAGAGPMFTASFSAELAFDGLRFTADQVLQADQLDGLTLTHNRAVTVGPAFLVQGGARAVARHNVVSSEYGPTLVLERVSGIEATDNDLTVTFVPDGSSPSTGMVLVAADPIDAETAAAGTVVARGNHVTNASGLGFVAVAYGGLLVADNDVDGLQGIVAVLVDVNRLQGAPAAPARVVDNRVRAGSVGIVGTGTLGDVTIADNLVTLEPDVNNFLVSQVGVVAAVQAGTTHVRRNVVQVAADPGVPTFGIWSYNGANGLSPGYVGFDGDNDVRDNLAFGVDVGVLGDLAVDGTLAVRDNTIFLARDGVVGITVGRAGGSLLAADFHGLPASTFVDRPLAITDNRVVAFELGDPSGAWPSGIEAWSLTWAAGAAPLVVARNDLVGSFAVGIQAVGTPAAIDKNTVTGRFDIGIDTLDFPDVDRGEAFGASVAAELVGAYADHFPASSSRVTSNTLRLLVKRPSAVPIVTEPGAYLRDNRFGWLVVRPWGP